MIPASYRLLLRTAHVPRALLTSMVARLPQGMVGLALVLLVEERTGSFGLAGVVSGAYVAAAGLGGPVLARLADRHGPRRVLLAAAATCAGASVALGAIPAATLPPLLLLAVVAGGTTPPISTVARALWPRLLPDQKRLTAMYALEATAQELTFIVGPSIVTLCVALVAPGAAVAASGLLALTGTALFVSGRAGERGSAGGSAGTGRGRIWWRGPATGLLVAAALSCAEIGVVATAERRGVPAAAGILLPFWSLGSLAGGLMAGARPSPLAPDRLLPRLLLVFALGHALLIPAPAPVVLGGVLVLAGATVAPAFAQLYALVERHAPAQGRTEAFAWLSTAFLAGGAIGAPLGGTLAETGSPSLPFLAAAALPLLAAALLRVPAPAPAEPCESTA